MAYLESFPIRSFSVHSAWGLGLWLALFNTLGVLFYAHRGAIESRSNRAALVALGLRLILAVAANRHATHQR